MLSLSLFLCRQYNCSVVYLVSHGEGGETICANINQSDHLVENGLTNQVMSPARRSRTLNIIAS